MFHPRQASRWFVSGDLRELSLPLKATYCCPKPPEHRQTRDQTEPKGKTPLSGQWLLPAAAEDQDRQNVNRKEWLNNKVTWRKMKQVILIN